jgi:sortase A
MRLAIAKNTFRALLKWTQRFLVACGVSLLGYSGFVLADTWVFQNRAESNLERRLDEQEVAGGVAGQNWPVIAPDGLIGRMEIPRLGLSVAIFEGTNKSTLRHAAGHIPGTALPGLPGNFGVAAHRDTLFRPLRQIQLHDRITLTTMRGEYYYGVVSTRVVNPYNVEVLDASDDEILTLITCYPFDFVGSAPSRFVVRAERVAR